MHYARCSSGEYQIPIFANFLDQARSKEDYPDDLPYPSCLISGMVNIRPLHSVMTYNNAGREAIGITVYEPDPDAIV